MGLPRDVIPHAMPSLGVCGEAIGDGNSRFAGGCDAAARRSVVRGSGPAAARALRSIRQLWGAVSKNPIERLSGKAARSCCGLALRSAQGSDGERYVSQGIAVERHL